MTIAPVVQSVTVAVPPERAFALFTRDIGRWWKPPAGGEADPTADMVIEPQVDGRWFRRTVSGEERPWGKVLAWEPPARLVLGWQLDAAFEYDPNLVTEVEISFDALAEGTRVTLVHRDLERFGDSAERIRTAVNGGWPVQLASFADYSKEAQQ